MSVDPNYYFNTGGQGGLTGGQGGLTSGLGRCGLGGVNQNAVENFNSGDINQFIGYPSTMLSQQSLHNLDYQSLQQNIHSPADNHQHQTTAYNQDMFTGTYRENNDLVYKSPAPANKLQNYQENFNLYNNINTNTCQTMSSNVANFAGSSNHPMSNTSYMSPSRHTVHMSPSRHTVPYVGNYDHPCIEMPKQMNPDIDNTLENDYRHSNTAAVDASLWPQAGSPQPSSWQQTADSSQQLMGSHPTWPNVPCGGQTNLNSDANWKLTNEESADGFQQVNHTLPESPGLELLYRETDRLIRNRSNSMTDVLPNKPADQIIPDRNFELLDQHFTSLRLAENLAYNQDYTMRRGSGTFQRTGATKGLDFGGRRRFPSMDPALFSSRGNNQAPGSHQESFLSSLLSDSTSPSLSQMELIWSPLVNPSKSISPINSSGSEILPIEEFVFQSDDDEDENSLFGKSDKVNTSLPKKREKSVSVSNPSKNAAPNLMPKKKDSKVKKSVSESEVCGSASTLAATSWSQIVRTKPSPAQVVRKRNTSAQSFASSPPLKHLSSSASPCSTPSPINLTTSATNLPAGSATNLPNVSASSNSFNQKLQTSDTCHSKAANEFHRGPKVDPRWPVENQVFLGPIPVAVTWEVIRNTFYEKVDRHHILHTYVQSKPVNDVVYGQIVFDKPSIASKMLKEGAIKIGEHVISVTAMKDKAKPAEKKR